MELFYGKEEKKVTTPYQQLELFWGFLIVTLTT
jgi:hypothetical protein